MPVRTKIELNPALIRRVSSLDDLARIFFPDNQNHRRAFILLWVSIKHANNSFLPSGREPPELRQVSKRTLEIVRARMKKLGLIRRVSHFSPEFGHQSGWVFSPRFRQSLGIFATTISDLSNPSGHKVDEQKDRDAILYI